MSETVAGTLLGGMAGAAEALFGEAFAAAERLRRGLRLEASPLTALPARGMAEAMFLMTRSSAGLLAAVTPSRDGRLAWRELANKVEVFELFQQAPGLLGLAPGGAPPLAERAERARALGESRAPWVIEGLAYHWADSAGERGGVPPGLLSGDDLPAASLIVLHTGTGIALAERALAERRPGRLAEALARFVELCRDNARPGYEAASLEALGLVARTLHPHLVPAIDRLLPRLDPELPALFWHGVGRALCFLPTNASPCASAPWRAVAMARHEPPGEEGRANALSGLAWALTLVNLRHPEVLETVLRHHGGLLAGDRRAAAAFADGVASALLVWHDLVPGDPYLAAFRRHRPATGAPDTMRLWERLIADPAAAGLEGYYPKLKRSGRLGELFRCRPLDGENVT